MRNRVNWDQSLRESKRWRQIWSITVWLSQQAFSRPVTNELITSADLNSLLPLSNFLMGMCWVRVSGREPKCFFCRVHTHIHSSDAFRNCHLEQQRADAEWSKLQFKDHLQDTSRRLSHVGLPMLLLCKSDHVRKKWKHPEGWMPSLFPLSVTSSRL